MKQTTTDNPILYLSCYDNTEWLEPTYAAIEITPAWAQRMCGLVHQMAALRQASHDGHGLSLYQMEYWDWTPLWCTNPAYDGPVSEFWDDIANDQALYVPAGGTAWLVGEHDLQSVDCVTLCVQEDGIEWHAHVKHADGARLWTETIPLRDLEHYARGEEPEVAVVWTYEPDATEEENTDVLPEKSIVLEKVAEN